MHVKFVSILLTLLFIAGDEDLLVKKFESAESPRQRRALSVELIQKAPLDSLQRLMMGKTDDVAIAAAWELVLRKSNSHFGENKIVTKPSDELLSWFVGFIEGRLRVQVPIEWNRCLKGLRAVGYFISTDIDPFSAEAPYTQTSDDTRSFPKSIKVEEKEEGIDLIVGSRHLLLPRNIALEEVEELRAISASAVGDKILVVFLPDLPAKTEKLFCFEKTGELKWTGSVWTGLGTRGGGFTGIGFQWVFWSSRDDIIYLFGAFTEGLYIEGFDVRDGQNIFRFHTTPRDE